MAKPTAVKPDDKLVTKDANDLKTALEKLGLKVGDLDKQLKADVKRSDLVAAIVALCRVASKKK